MNRGVILMASAKLNALHDVPKQCCRCGLREAVYFPDWQRRGSRGDVALRFKRWFVCSWVCLGRLERQMKICVSR